MSPPDWLNRSVSRLKKASESDKNTEKKVLKEPVAQGGFKPEAQHLKSTKVSS